MSTKKNQTELNLFQEDEKESSGDKFRRESELLQKYPTLIDFITNNKLPKQREKRIKKWKESNFTNR
mgnify:CR=1 FL=1